MKTIGIEEYNKYVEKTFNRYDAFLATSNEFSIEKAMYPGSYIHITPSLMIPEVIYVDKDKKAIKFFENTEEINNFIDNNKIYNEKTIVRFEAKDYWKELSVPQRYADLLISQYAGFVSQACKKYLKKEGILLANDSHGDATMAYVDEDYEFIGVLEYRKGKYILVNEDLDKYFSFKRDRAIDIDKVKELMKGPKYKIISDYYIFRKISVQSDAGKKINLCLF